MLDWIKNRLLASGFGFLVLSSLLLPVYKLSRENTHPENICDIDFEKAKDRGGTVNRISFYADAVIRRVFFKEFFLKKSVMRSFEKFAKRHVS